MAARTSLKFEVNLCRWTEWLQTLQLCGQTSLPIVKINKVLFIINLLIINYWFLISRRAAAIARPASSVSAESDGLPFHWTSVPDDEEYSCVPLQTISDEYKRTEKKFQETMDGSRKVISIERVQNPDLWTVYMQ